MHLLIGLFHVWLVLLAVALALLAVALPFVLLIAGVAKVRDDAMLRAQAHQQAWDQKMLATEWGREIVAAREQFRDNPPAWVPRPGVVLRLFTAGGVLIGRGNEALA